MRFGRDRGASGGRSPRAIRADWRAADTAGDAEGADAAARELLAVAPDDHRAWYDAGLLSKALGDWAESARRNARALELFTPKAGRRFAGENPAAWNLGIAATALGDWATARRAWAAYGLDLGPGARPIDADMGIVGIRLNPDRPAMTHQVLTRHGATEVVWCWRRGPAHAVISSVPLPESGHRFRDVVLHDGVPAGTRTRDRDELPVFDELSRLADSELPTWQATVGGVSPQAYAALGDAFDRSALGVDDWSSMRMMCAECSHGDAGRGHHHQHLDDRVRRLGIAGPENVVREVLQRWSTTFEVEVQSLAHLW